MAGEAEALKTRREQLLRERILQTVQSTNRTVERQQYGLRNPQEQMATQEPEEEQLLAGEVAAPQEQVQSQKPGWKARRRERKQQEEALSRRRADIDAEMEGVMKSGMAIEAAGGGRGSAAERLTLARTGGNLGAYLDHLATANNSDTATIKTQTDAFYEAYPQYPKSTVFRDIVRFKGMDTPLEELNATCQNIEKLSDKEARQKATDELMPAYQAAYDRIRSRMEAIGTDKPVSYNDTLLRTYKMSPVYKDAQIVRDIGNRMGPALPAEQKIYMVAVCEYVVKMIEACKYIGKKDQASLREYYTLLRDGSLQLDAHISNSFDKRNETFKRDFEALLRHGDEVEARLPENSSQRRSYFVSARAALEEGKAGSFILRTAMNEDPEEQATITRRNTEFFAAAGANREMAANVYKRDLTRLLHMIGISDYDTWKNLFDNVTILEPTNKNSTDPEARDNAAQAILPILETVTAKTRATVTPLLPEMEHPPISYEDAGLRYYKLGKLYLQLQPSLVIAKIPELKSKMPKGDLEFLQAVSDYVFALDKVMSAGGGVDREEYDRLVFSKILEAVKV